MVKQGGKGVARQRPACYVRTAVAANEYVDGAMGEVRDAVACKVQSRPHRHRTWQHVVHHLGPQRVWRCFPINSSCLVCATRLALFTAPCSFPMRLPETCTLHMGVSEEKYSLGPGASSLAAMLCACRGHGLRPERVHCTAHSLVGHIGTSCSKVSCTSNAVSTLVGCSSLTSYTVEPRCTVHS